VRRRWSAPDRSVVAIGVVALIGLVWRVVYTADQFRGDTDITNEGDAFLYSTTAFMSARGNWFVHFYYGGHVADHPPLTVLSLVPTGWLFPDSVMAQRYTFCILGAVAIVLIGLLARSLAGSVAGVAAAVVAAANPNLWMNDAVVMSETISTVLIAGLLWAAVELRRSPTLRRAALVGVLCGFTILARAEIGLFLPFLIVPAIVLARELPWRDRLVRSAVAVVLAGLVVAPWTLWNLTELEEPVLISANDGTTLLGANCDRTQTGRTIGSWSLQCIEDFNDAHRTEERGLDISEVSALQRDEAVDNITGDLSGLPKIVFARLGRTFGWWEIGQQVYINQGEGRPEWASWAGYWTFWALVPVSIAGAVALRRRRADLLPAAATLLTVLVVSAAFYGISRFRLPLDVMTCVLAGAAVAALVERLRSRRPGEPDPPGSSDPADPSDPEVSETPAAAATAP
jgi:4-amino-4-deoxy-L-arabinose transferase-like glycosyltransferase